MEFTLKMCKEGQLLLSVIEEETADIRSGDLQETKKKINESFPVFQTTLLEVEVTLY